MKKRLISLLLFASLACGLFAACGGASNESPESGSTSISVPDEDTIEEIDYVGQLKLDMSSNSLKQEVTVKQFVDGDTTHFNVPTTIAEDGILKARYTAINTPESTGTIEPWGKKASNFTRSKLENAVSIIVETDSEEWEHDANGRFLVWVWYKTTAADDYRNLNVEILQNGLAYANKSSSSRYGEVASSAFSQAKALKLNLYSEEKDPDFYYGEAIELTLKELRTNPEKYLGKRVAFEGTVTNYDNWNINVEDYDEETERYYGITVFYGYHTTFHKILAPGNRARIVGKLSYYEAGGTYQLSDLKYDKMKPNDPNNTLTLATGKTPAYKEITADEFNSNVTLQLEENDPTTGDPIVTSKTFNYAELAMNTSVSMKNLTVVRAYTTNNGGSNQGAITLTCTVGSQTITVRTAVLMNAEGELVTQDEFIGKTIDVKGFVDSYDGEYQIKLYYLGAITIHE